MGMFRIMIPRSLGSRRRSRTVRRPLGAVLITLLLVAALTPMLKGVQPAQAATAWPLEVSADGRLLLDQQNRPFLMTADTSWSLLTLLTDQQAQRYIDLRKQQGFNTILTNISFFSRTTSGPRGTAFEGDDMTKPREEYFAGIDRIMKYAESKDMVLMVGTMWTANNGGREGGRWPTDSEFDTYAKFLADRYANQGNLIWFMGGDDDPKNDSKLVPWGASLNKYDTSHLIAAHNWNKFTQLSAPWLDLNTFQWNSNTAPFSYQDIAEMRSKSPKPTMNMEPAYDPTTCCGEDKNTTPQKVRRGVWWAILSGAFGVAYGGPRATWNVGENGFDESAITRPAASQVGHVSGILSKYQWQLLEPNNDAIKGKQGGTEQVTAAAASNGSLMVAYTPTPQTLSVNGSLMQGNATAQWFNPTTGEAVGQATTVNGNVSLQSPGSEDAVLVVSTAAATQTPAPQVDVTPPGDTTTPEPTNPAPGNNSDDSSDSSDPSDDSDTSEDNDTSGPSTTTTTRPRAVTTVVPTTVAPTTTVTVPTAPTTPRVTSTVAPRVTSTVAPRTTPTVVKPPPTSSATSGLLIQARNITGSTTAKVVTKFGNRTVTSTAEVDKGMFMKIVKIPAGYKGPATVNVIANGKVVKVTTNVS